LTLHFRHRLDWIAHQGIEVPECRGWWTSSSRREALSTCACLERAGVGQLVLAKGLGFASRSVFLPEPLGVPAQQQLPIARHGITALHSGLSYGIYGELSPPHSIKRVKLPLVAHSTINEDLLRAAFTLS
jgi:hypothetical protein